MCKKMYDYWLCGLEGIGRKTFFMLRDEGYDGEKLYHCDENKLPSFLNEKQKNSIKTGKRRTQKELLYEYEKLNKQGIFMTFFGDADYPKRLYRIPDSPAVLFYKGSLPKEKQKNIAIIGARNCSEYGKVVAAEFATYFAKKGICVVSGMAMGVDGYAQMAAIREGGFSVGVLGSGVNVCYPKEHVGLYNNLIQKGCVMSEYLPYINASANLFPPRNRIISGLSDALLVVEAKEKSGTLITVEMALEQGKEVYVVPGRITDALSKGCNRLLLEGANPVISPQKMLEDIYGDLYECENKEKMEEENEVKKIILSFLEVTPLHINVLRERTGFPLEILSRELLHLVLEDKIVQVGNQWYQINANQL